MIRGGAADVVALSSVLHTFANQSVLHLAQMRIVCLTVSAIEASLQPRCAMCLAQTPLSPCVCARRLEAQDRLSAQMATSGEPSGGSGEVRMLRAMSMEAI